VADAPDTHDTLVVDEAHRLNAKSGLYRNLGENQVRELIRLHNLSQNMLYGREIATKPATRKVAPKYRDPATGSTWAGRGRAPAWFDASRKHLFEIGD
jgi:DNA-binding protein H-NS